MVYDVNFRRQIKQSLLVSECAKNLACNANKFEKMHSNSRFVPLALETDTNLT